MAERFRTYIDSILRTYGHNIYLQRVKTPYNGEKPEYENKLETHTVRHMMPSAAGKGILEENIEGWTYDAEMIYYFRWDVNPTTGDRIYENIERYPNNLNTWIVSFAIPFRGTNGVISFWSCGVDRETPQ